MDEFARVRGERLQFGRALSGAETANVLPGPGIPPGGFNSAAPSQARRHPGGSLVEIEDIASIRPRPLRRGDDGTTYGRIGIRLASIRPRPLRRGDAVTRRVPPLQGQASIRPRPLRRGDLERAVLPDRPDAASIRPRPLRRGDAWGRSRWSGTPGCFNSAAPSQARRQAVEIARRVGTSGLQFGRALSGAETKTPASSCSTPGGCFNSAAPSQARRPDHRRNRRQLVRGASIRPRPLRRGDRSMSRLISG